MEFATDLVDLTTKMQRFMMTKASELPEFTLEKVLEFSGHPSPVDRIVNTAEALYAVKGQLSAEGRVMTAQLAQFAAVNGWHGMSERGLQISRAMQRIGGYQAPEGTSWPDASEDPEPLSTMLTPADPPADPAGPPE